MAWLQDATWWPIAAGLFFILLALVARRTWLWRQRYLRDVRQQRSYKAAKNDYERVRKRLEARHNVTVVDLIDDLGDVFKGRDQAPTHIDFEAAMAALNRIRYAKDGPIDIVLHTLGGYSLAAEMIGAALQAHKGRVRTYVPFLAMSGGTMIALAADRIHMGKNAALGPIDSFIGGFSLEDYARLRREKPIAEIFDYWLLMAYEAEKHQNDANRRACEIMDSAHKKTRTDCQVVDALMSSNLPHGMRIGYGLAKEIGINVTEDCPEEVYELVESRLQMIKVSEKRRNGNGEPENGHAQAASYR